jgi:hypothetical protein
MDLPKRKLTEDIQQYRKEYYTKHKDDYYKKKIVCDICFVQYTKINKSRHAKSLKHQLALKDKEINTLSKKILGLEKEIHPP